MPILTECVRGPATVLPIGVQVLLSHRFSSFPLDGAEDPHVRHVHLAPGASWWRVRLASHLTVPTLLLALGALFGSVGESFG